MNPLPTVGQYMTLAPKTISYDQTIEKASEYMRKLHVRHLPVAKGGRLIGTISDRDINLLLTFQDRKALTMTVESVLTPHPFFTTPDTSLDEIARRMVEEKCGCVLVMELSRLVGIFTAGDALKALADVYRRSS